jgi:hypothetical protein
MAARNGNSSTPLALGGDSRDAQMRVGSSIAMSGEMLGGGKDAVTPVAFGPLDECFRVTRHYLRVLAEGTDIDDGIIGVVVDVSVRIKDPLDADRPRLSRRDLAFVTCERRLSGGSECHGVWKYGGIVQAHRSAALEIA